MRSLLSTLDDPIEILPLQCACGTLALAAQRSEEALFAKMGWRGVPRRNWTVEEEHYQAEIVLLVGSSFVLGQLALTKSVAMIQRIRQEMEDASSVPKERTSILAWHAGSHPPTGLSELLIIDACANYFKHQREWPSDWDVTTGTQFQQRTIEVVRRLGLSPGAEGDNVNIALRSLGASLDSMDSLGDKIQSWRESVAASLRKLLVE